MDERFLLSVVASSGKFEEDEESKRERKIRENEGVEQNRGCYCSSLRYS